MNSPTFNPDNEVEALQGKVDAIILFPDVSLTSEAKNIALANSKLKEQMELLGGDSLYDSEFLTQDSNAFEDLILVVPWFSEKGYANRAQKRWKIKEISWRTATSYDATQALIHALINLSSSPVTRQNVLQELKDINLRSSQTSGEPLQFEDNGDRDTEPVLVQVKDGRFVLIE